MCKDIREVCKDIREVVKDIREVVKDIREVGKDGESTPRRPSAPTPVSDNSKKRSAQPSIYAFSLITARSAGALH
jgi:hypothetical protein